MTYIGLLLMVFALPLPLKKIKNYKYLFKLGNDVLSNYKIQTEHISKNTVKFSTFTTTLNFSLTFIEYYDTTLRQDKL